MVKEYETNVADLQEKMEWRKVKSETYRNAAHEYVTKNDYPMLWAQLAKLIHDHSEYRSWRGHKFKYLEIEGYVYWRDGIIINRTYREALDNNGFPSKTQQQRIFKRFWGGTK